VKLPSELGWVRFFKIGSWEGQYAQARSAGFVVSGSESDPAVKASAAWNFAEIGHIRLAVEEEIRRTEGKVGKNVKFPLLA
jgi:hypothetical protein